MCRNTSLGYKTSLDMLLNATQIMTLSFLHHSSFSVFGWTQFFQQTNQRRQTSIGSENRSFRTTPKGNYFPLRICPRINWIRFHSPNDQYVHGKCPRAFHPNVSKRHHQSYFSGVILFAKETKPTYSSDLKPLRLFGRACLHDKNCQIQCS